MRLLTQLNDQGRHWLCCAASAELRAEQVLNCLCKGAVPRRCPHGLAHITTVCSKTAIEQDASGMFFLAGRATAMVPACVLNPWNTATGSSSVDEVIAQQRDNLERTREQLHRQLVSLTGISIRVKGRPDMTEVTTTTLPAMHLVGLARTTAAYSDEGELWGELYPLLLQTSATLPADGICRATYYSSEELENDRDVEVWVQFAEPISVAQPQMPIRTLESTCLTNRCLNEIIV